MRHRVLVVDDNRHLLPLLLEVLTLAGFEAAGAGSVAEARAAQGPFDALVLDVQLPNGDGRQIAEVWDGTPTITISGGPGADLQKPFSMQALVAAVTARAGAPGA